MEGGGGRTARDGRGQAPNRLRPPSPPPAAWPPPGGQGRGRSQALERQCQPSGEGKTTEASRNIVLPDAPACAGHLTPPHGRGERGTPAGGRGRTPGTDGAAGSRYRSDVQTGWEMGEKKGARAGPGDPVAEPPPLPHRTIPDAQLGRACRAGEVHHPRPRHEAGGTGRDPPMAGHVCQSIRGKEREKKGQNRLGHRHSSELCVLGKNLQQLEGRNPPRKPAQRLTFPGLCSY